MYKRQLYDSFQRKDPSVTEEILESLSDFRERQCREVNLLRQSVPGLSLIHIWAGSGIAMGSAAAAVRLA